MATYVLAVYDSEVGMYMHTYSNIEVAYNAIVEDLEEWYEDVFEIPSFDAMLNIADHRWEDRCHNLSEGAYIVAKDNFIKGEFAYDGTMTCFIIEEV